MAGAAGVPQKGGAETLHHWRLSGGGARFPVPQSPHLNQPTARARFPKYLPLLCQLSPTSPLALASSSRRPSLSILRSSCLSLTVTFAFRAHSRFLFDSLHFASGFGLKSPTGLNFNDLILRKIYEIATDSSQVANSTSRVQFEKCLLCAKFFRPFWLFRARHLL